MAVYKVTTTVGQFSETVLVEARLPSQAIKNATKISVSAVPVKSAEVARLVRDGVAFIEAVAVEASEDAASELEIAADEVEVSI